MIVADDDLSSETDIKLQYSLEYLDDLITLKDGIGYNAKGFSKQGISRTF